MANKGEEASLASLFSPEDIEGLKQRIWLDMVHDIAASEALQERLRAEQEALLSLTGEP